MDARLMCVAHARDVLYADIEKEDEVRRSARRCAGEDTGEVGD